LLKAPALVPFRMLSASLGGDEKLTSAFRESSVTGHDRHFNHSVED
jgi:hypothetical protein